jgi:hypothetical protein
MMGIFTPKTFLDYLTDNGLPDPFSEQGKDFSPELYLLPYRKYKRIMHNPTQYRCPCGCWVTPSRLVDLRSVNKYDEDWACDGCNSARMRESGPVRSVARANWKKQWLRDLGAPQEAIDRIPNGN